MNLDKSIFRWDSYSDQPATLSNRIKRRLRRRSIGSIARKLYSVLYLPWPVTQTILHRRTIRTHANDDNIGLCLNLERPFEGKKILSVREILDIISPLNLRRIAIRIPLSDMENMQLYVDFIRQFSEYKILAVIVQDRSAIENLESTRNLLGQDIFVPVRYRGMLSNR